jgi:hypothetical protein
MISWRSEKISLKWLLPICYGGCNDDNNSDSTASLNFFPTAEPIWLVHGRADHAVT